MRLDDFFEDRVDPLWGGNTTTPDMDLIARLRLGPVPGDNDLETALSLTRLVHSELEAFGTGGGERLSNTEIEIAQRSLRQALARHGLDLNLPWRDFTSFRSHWIAEGCAGDGGWQARRDLLAKHFDETFAELNRREDASYIAAVAEPVSPAGKTGWPAVDEAIHDVTVRFRTATTAADYSDVGRRCIALLERLSAVVYNPSMHLRDGETEPPVTKTHMRIQRFVEDAAPGPGNSEVRGLVKKAAELAEATKHRTASRRDAGVTADATILLANILRRLAES